MPRDELERLQALRASVDAEVAAAGGAEAVIVRALTPPPYAAPPVPEIVEVDPLAAQQPVPAPPFVVEGAIPCRQVTLLGKVCKTPPLTAGCETVSA